MLIIKNDIKYGGSGDLGIIFLLYNTNNNVRNDDHMLQV